MTSVLVKLVENLSRTHAELVRQAGHAVDRVTDEGLSGAVDPVVWKRIVAERPDPNSAAAWCSRPVTLMWNSTTGPDSYMLGGALLGR